METSSNYNMYGDKYRHYNNKFNEENTNYNTNYNKYNNRNNKNYSRNDYVGREAKARYKRDLLTQNQRINSDLEDDVFAYESARPMNNNKSIFDSQFKTHNTNYSQNTNNIPTSPIKDLYTSMIGKEGNKFEEKASGRNVNLVGSVQEELEMMRVSLSEEISEDGGGGGFNKGYEYDNSYYGDKNGGGSSGRSSGEGGNKTTSPAHSRRKTLSIQEYEPTSIKSKSVSVERGSTNDESGPKSRSTSTAPKKVYKPILVPPHVDNTTGLPRFVTSVDLSGFRLSVTKVGVFIDPLSDRRLVVEAMESGSKGKVTKCFRKKMSLPRFADVFGIKHRINVMGVLKIEIPLLYYSEQIATMNEDEANRTNAYVYNNNRRLNFNNEINNRRRGEMEPKEAKDELEIVVKPAEGVKIENIRVKIQDNIIVISEIIPGEKNDNELNMNSEDEHDNHFTNHDNDDESRRSHRGSDSRNGQMNNQHEAPNKVRFVRLYRVPSSAIKEKIRCLKIANGSLKIVIPVMGF